MYRVPWTGSLWHKSAGIATLWSRSNQSEQNNAEPRPMRMENTDSAGRDEWEIKIMAGRLIKEKIKISKSFQIPSEILKTFPIKHWHCIYWKLGGYDIFEPQINACVISFQNLISDFYFFIREIELLLTRIMIFYANCKNWPIYSFETLKLPEDV